MTDFLFHLTPDLTLNFPNAPLVILEILSKHQQGLIQRIWPKSLDLYVWLIIHKEVYSQKQITMTGIHS